MKLIAKSPTFVSEARSAGGYLTPGKEYEVIDIFFPNSLYKSELREVWFSFMNHGELKYNSKDPKFYVRILDDNNHLHDFWNDYFLSTEEIREINLNKLEI